MSHLHRSDYWQLAISHWPEAVKAGLRPCVAPTGFPDPWQPQWYQPRTIEFRHPPSREEFLQVVRQTPWMTAWRDDLLPLIEQNDWPMVDFAHKGSTVDLIDADGNVCGELRVWRQQVFNNDIRDVPMVTVDVINRVACRKPPAARELLWKSGNRVQERMVAAGDHGDERMVYELRLILNENGFLARASLAPPQVPEVTT